MPPSSDAARHAGRQRGFWRPICHGFDAFYPHEEGPVQCGACAIPAHCPMLSVTLLNFGLRTFPSPGYARGRFIPHPFVSSAGRSLQPQRDGIFQPSGKQRRSAALSLAGMGCRAEGAGQRHCLSGFFLSGIRETRTLYAKRRFRFLTISPALCSIPRSGPHLARPQDPDSRKLAGVIFMLVAGRLYCVPTCNLRNIFGTAQATRTFTWV